jgi:endonuclease YncB( thermonuclease family)
MRKEFRIALFSFAFAFVLPAAAHAAGPADAYAGKIVLDVSSHGEAWYVDPHTRMRSFLGRPAEALERLRDHAVMLSFGEIARLSDDPALPGDATYASQVAGEVLVPDDLVGAAWYADPSTGLRERLATPNDAWLVMRAGTPVSKAVLKAIPVEGAKPSKTQIAVVKDVVDGTTLALMDGRKVRVLNVDVPSNPDLQAAAVAKLATLAKGKTVLLERDVRGTDADGTLLRHVYAGTTDVGYELVRDGLAFQDVAFPDVENAEQYIVGGLDAMRLKRGFWNNPSNQR